MQLRDESVGSALPFVVLGVVSVVAGGLVAAVTGPTGWEHGSWAAAYLVLVTGVAQVGLGVAQAGLAATPLSRRRLSVELVGWNVGSALVILGTLLTAPPVVVAGSALLVIALVTFALTVQGATVGPTWVRVAFLLLVLVLLVSIPVGVVLSVLRS
ncbi:MAG TPA: hypothetical protein VFN19_10075 [Candidatus Nanopelagicales bacterium]|nr:hypothetical protein [Candidatus Nanopelagicales bacterium]